MVKKNKKLNESNEENQLNSEEVVSKKTRGDNTSFLVVDAKKPSKVDLKWSIPSLKKNSILISLTLLVTGWALLLFDLVDGFSALIDRIDNAINNLTSNWIDTTGKIFEIFDLIWFILGLVIGVYVFYTIAKSNIRKSVFEGKYQWINERITKFKLPKISLFGALLFVLSFRFRLASLMIFLSGIVLMVAINEDEMPIVDKETIWDSLKELVKIFSLLGTAILILGLITGLIGIGNIIYVNMLFGISGWPFFSPILERIIGVVVIGLLVYYYLRPFYIAHILNDGWENLVKGNISVHKYKVPMILIFLIVISVLDYDGFEFMFLLSSAALIYVFAPIEINWTRKYDAQKKDKAKKSEDNDIEFSFSEENNENSNQLSLNKTSSAHTEVIAEKEEVNEESSRQEKDVVHVSEEEAIIEDSEDKVEEIEDSGDDVGEEEEEELDEPDEDDKLSFPQVEPELIALFEDGNYFGTLDEFIQTIEEKITLPEGLTPKEAINIMKDKDLVYYSRSSPRGYHKKE